MRVVQARVRLDLLFDHLEQLRGRGGEGLGSRPTRRPLSRGGPPEGIAGELSAIAESQRDSGRRSRPARSQGVVRVGVGFLPHVGRSDPAVFSGPNDPVIFLF